MESVKQHGERVAMKCRSVVALLVLVGLSGCGKPQAGSSVGESPSWTEGDWWPEPGSVELATLAWPPVSTFQRACASCHMPEGSRPQRKTAALTDEQLVAVVGDMMKSSGIGDASDADVAAMAAYQRALAADEVFICVTDFEPATDTDAGVLEGEATPEVDVMLMTCGYCWTTADPNGFWELHSPMEWPQLIAQQDLKATELSMPTAQWSHALAPP